MSDQLSSDVRKYTAMLNLKEKDKQLHFLAGFLIGGVLYPFLGYFAVLAAITVGLVKEYVVDEISSSGEPDIWDAVATALGAVSVGVIFILVKLILR